MPVRSGHPRGDEKHYRQLAHRLGAPLIREVLAGFRRDDVSASAAADKLGLGRTRFYQLYADYLRAVARHQQHHWTPTTSGGDHAPDWPHGTEALLRKLARDQTARALSLRRLGSPPPPGRPDRSGHRASLGHRPSTGSPRARPPRCAAGNA